MNEKSGVAAGLSSLPSGGGGITPLGERFQPDLVRGSGSYAVPLKLPKGPNELQPDMKLTYSTGSGNGAFGFGWRLNVMRIERRTDRGTPTYTDDDTFVIGDAEVLVHVGANRYRPQTDNKSWHIERTGTSWHLRTGDGRTLLFGLTAQSRESEGGKVFAWYLEEERDAAGNTIRCTYKSDGKRLYLEEVHYSIFKLRIQYEPRPDVLRSGRSGFLRLTSLRAKTIELHCDKTTPTLMRTYSFTYRQAENNASLLAGCSLWAEEDGETARFPDLTFEYSHPNFENWQVHEPRSLVAPPDLEDPSTRLVDLTGDGLPDVLQGAGPRMYSWRNSGDGWFEGPTALDGVPSTVSLSRDNVAFADLNGNGRVDLFAVDQPLQLAFEADGRGGFQPDPVIFHQRPNLRLAAENTRLMDVDGDGVVDLICTGRDYHLLYRHEPGEGWEDPQPVRRIADLEQFPDVTLGDNYTRLADMGGDGLQDFVVLQSGNISYWPYLGNGTWGERVTMPNSPRFPEGFREEQVYLVDIDGDGCADIVYIDYDRILIWLNQSGSDFGAPIEIPVSPGGSAFLIPADFFGDGRPGFAWTATANREYSSGYRFLRFDGGRKPYLMTTIENGMGGSFEISYSTSTAMRLKDAVDNNPWMGQLPFPVHVVGSIRERDLVTGQSTEKSMRYHDGIYDGIEREFRGFTRVTVDTDGDDSIPTTQQEFTFFQGDPEHSDPVERNRQRAIAGALLTTEIFEKVGEDYQLRSTSVQEWDARLEHDDPKGKVFFPFLMKIEIKECGSGTSPSRIERTLFPDYDIYGNPVRRVRESFAQGEPPSEWIRTEEHFSYTANETQWLVKLPVRLELRDGSSSPFAVKITYYDGSAFTGLPEGQVEHGLISCVKELQLLESSLPAGYVGGRDFGSMGYELMGVGDTRGYYAPTTAYKRDARGNVIEQRDPLGNVLEIVYDGDGVFPEKTIDAMGRETTLVFNPRPGEPMQVNFPDGRTLRYKHDPIGRLAASYETDDAGVEQLVKYWVVDLASTPASLTSISPGSGGRTLEEFLTCADFTLLSDVSVSRVYYDGFGSQDLQVSTAPEGPGGTSRFVTVARAQLNPRKLTAVNLPPAFVPNLNYIPAGAAAPASVRYRYDALGNSMETAGPGPVHHRVVRDTFTIHHYEGAGAGAFGTAVPPGPPVRIEHFDSRARLVRIEEARDSSTLITTSYNLTIDGRIEVIYDDAGQEMASYTYAGPGEAIAITHRDVGTRTYYRDAAGHMVERISTDGSTLFYNYDVLGRLKRIEHAEAGSHTRQTIREIFYDSDPGQPSDGRFLVGRIALVREMGNEIRYSYNRVGKRVREEVTVGSTTLVTAREFDLRGHLTAIVYPDGHRVEYSRDDGGEMSGIPGVVTGVTYEADGAIIGYRLNNGVDIAMPCDPDSRRLTEVSATNGTSVLRRLTYNYDTVGNITGVRDEMPGSIEQNIFTYDGIYRIESFSVHESGSGSPVRSGTYAYDAAGNIRQIEENQSLTLSYADMARPGRATSVTVDSASQVLGYNNRGHITAFGDLTGIDYDPLDRVSRIVKADGTEIHFAYDPQSRRILKEVTHGGNTKRIFYATGLYELHDTHAIRHIYLGNRMIASEKVAADMSGSTEPVYYLSDRHGTILLATDAAGAIVHNQRYSPYGITLDSSDALDRYLGRERDAETGLIQLGVRYYAPFIGRFISPDWFVLENPGKPARMPQGYNLYSYALNNPLVFKDPNGMWFLIDDLIVAAVGFVVGFVTGLIYGLANGQGWGSLLTALETGLTTAAGAWLGWNIGGPVGAIMGGMNGLIGGIHGIYDWTSVEGWFAFISDSTWGLIGTSLGNIVHVVNLFYSDANYREDLSRRQNRHVYEGGFALKSGMAFTQGNVISNAGLGTGTINESFISNHEELHIWQSRIFGPLFQATYIVWAVGGFLVGSVVWFFNTDEDYGNLIETAAYYDNPFEYWAYNNDDNWRPSGANPLLAWPE